MACSRTKFLNKLEKEEENKKLKEEAKYTVNEFALTLQYWAFEAILESEGLGGISGRHNAKDVGLEND